MSDFQPHAKVIADSISNETGVRLTTLEIRLHRSHIAFLTAHRAISRTFHTRRDSPAYTTDQITREPVYPGCWTRHQFGGPLSTAKTDAARKIWDDARHNALTATQQLQQLGVHRSITNRLLDPFSAVTTIVTATDDSWDDFFSHTLHRHPDADKPFAEIIDVTRIAQNMRNAIDLSIPEKLTAGQWHLPYLDAWQLTNLSLRTAIHTCAVRVAASTHPQDQLEASTPGEIFRRIWILGMGHLGPLEHLATPAHTTDTTRGNLTGWHQLRHLDWASFG